MTFIFSVLFLVPRIDFRDFQDSLLLTPTCMGPPGVHPTRRANLQCWRGGGGPGSPLKACLSGSQGAQERISCLEISSMMMRVTGYLIKTGFNKII